MKIPKKIKISGHVFKILPTKEVLLRDKAGRTVGEKNLIWINATYEPSKQASILIHEILHEINWLNDLDMNESQISSVAEGLYQVLSDNKLLKK